MLLEPGMDHLSLHAGIGGYNDPSDFANFWGFVGLSYRKDWELSLKEAFRFYEPWKAGATVHVGIASMGIQGSTYLINGWASLLFQVMLVSLK